MASPQLEREAERLKAERRLGPPLTQAERDILNAYADTGRTVQFHKFRGSKRGKYRGWGISLNGFPCCRPDEAVQKARECLLLRGYILHGAADGN